MSKSIISKALSLLVNEGPAVFINRLQSRLASKAGSPTYWIWKIRGTKPIKVSGYEIKIKISDYLGDYREVRFFEENEVDEMKDILSEIKEDDVFLDIGANIGIHSIFGSNIAKETYAIEPHPVNSSYLLVNKYLNRADIQVYNCAFSNNNQYIGLAGPRGGLLADGSAALSHHSIPSKAGPGHKSNKIYIRAEQGDKFLKDNQLSVPNVVKIDVEGEEDRVIDGLENTLKNQKCRLVYCEIHEERANYEKIIGKLEKFGFDILVLDVRDYSKTIKAEKH